MVRKRLALKSKERRQYEIARMFVVQSLRRMSQLIVKVERLEKERERNQLRHKQIVDLFIQIKRMIRSTHTKSKESTARKLMDWFDKLSDDDLWSDLHRLEVKDKMITEQKMPDDYDEQIDLVEELLNKEWKDLDTDLDTDLDEPPHNV